MKLMRRKENKRGCFGYVIAGLVILGAIGILRVLFDDGSSQLPVPAPSSSTPTAPLQESVPKLSLDLEGFANINGHRFYTVRMSTGVNRVDVDAFISNRVVNDRGRGTHAYFYEPGARIPTLDQAKEVWDANTILYEDPRFDSWRYAYQKSLSGVELFVDCKATINEALCR